MADWKKIYGPDWPSGKRKVQKIIDTLNAHGIKAKYHRFMSGSIEYTSELIFPRKSRHNEELAVA